MGQDTLFADKYHLYDVSEHSFFLVSPKFLFLFTCLARF